MHIIVIDSNIMCNTDNSKVLMYNNSSSKIIFTNMCSASHPSLLANIEPILKAKHFFPSRELPPYPLPNEQISFLSGM